MTEILEIFSKCTTCGFNGAKVRTIEAWAKKNGIMYATHKTGNQNHKVSSIRHMEYLRQAGLPESYHTGIVVEDTNKITLLKEWKAPE